MCRLDDEMLNTPLNPHTWLRSWCASSRPGERPVEGRRVGSFLHTDVDEVSTSSENESVGVFVWSRTIPCDTQPS